MPDIRSSRIKGSKDKIQAHKIKDGVYKVYNPTSGSAYDVVRTGNGVWTCNCPYNTKGSRLREGNCKHIVRVMDKENGCGLCGRTDKYADLKREYVDEPFLCKTCRVTLSNQIRVRGL